MVSVVSSESIPEESGGSTKEGGVLVQTHINQPYEHTILRMNHNLFTHAKAVRLNKQAPCSAIQVGKGIFKTTTGRLRMLISY